MKKTVLLFGSLITGILFIESCSPPKEVEKSTVLTNVVLNAEDTLMANVDNTTRVQGQAHAGQYSFRADSAHEYAAGVKIDLHDSLVNSTVRVILSYWIKSNNPLKGDGMAVAFQNNAEMSSWTSFDIINSGAKANEWINVTDSVTIGADKFTKPGMFFKIFAYTPNKKAIVDIDDVNVTVKKIVKVME